MREYVDERKVKIKNEVLRLRSGRRRNGLLLPAFAGISFAGMTPHQITPRQGNAGAGGSSLSFDYTQDRFRAGQARVLRRRAGDG